MSTKRDRKFADCIIFFDFDNTITKFDVLDDMLERFSRDDKWLKLEEEWKRGRIGSRLCLDGQMRGIRIGRKALDRYLMTIKLDPSFKKLLKFCDSRSMKKVILSDDFGYILKRILKHNGISGLDIYCNSLKLSQKKLIPSFPHRHSKCDICAHCKTKNMLANIGSDSMSIYVGDGLSDLCPSMIADLVFAKGSLKERLKAEKVPFVPFENLNDVYEYIKERTT